MMCKKRLLLTTLCYLAGLSAVANAGDQSAGNESDWDITDTGQPYVDAGFTLTEGTWMTVDVSPDGKSLMFDLLGDIYTMPATGGDARLVLGGPALQHQPRYSPDGSKILFISDASGSDNVWIARPDGSEARQITRETLNKMHHPTWGPKGDYIIATKFQANLFVNPEIWRYHIQGGTGQSIVNQMDVKTIVDEARYSPDGRYLYFTNKLAAPLDFFINTNQPNFSIDRRDLETGAIETVLQGYGGATTAQISPDGNRIAFVRRIKAKTVLFVYDRKTGEQRPVFDGLERDAQGSIYRSGFYPGYDWFPDGLHVAIWAGGKLLKVNVETQSIENIPFKANARHRITKALHFKNNLEHGDFTIRSIQQIAVAPGGKKMVFNALGHLWHKTLPEGTPERLTHAEEFEFEPAYSADGRQLVYVAWQDETGSALRVTRANGRGGHTLVTSMGTVRTPVFSPDGNYIAYTIQKGDDHMSGYRAKPGLYLVASKGGEAKHLAEAADTPHFSADGTRIFYTRRETGKDGVVIKLESVQLNGLDKREHAVSKTATELHLSPDQRWLSFKQNYQYAVIPYRPMGTVLDIDSDKPQLPMVTLTDSGGFHLTWSSDSRRVYWMFGDQLFDADIPAQFAGHAKPPVDGVAIGLTATADKPEGAIAFINGRIITMRGDDVIENGALVVASNKIIAVGPASQVEIPATATVIDVSGKTLLPGLVDMHGHLGLFSTGLIPQKHPNHYAALAYGITTDFDPSSQDYPSYAIAEMNRAGIMVGPRMINAGKIIYGLPGRVEAYNRIDGFEDARNAIRRKKALGSIFVKSYMQPMRRQRQQIIKAAREANIQVTPEGDAYPYNNIAGILDGHTAIEHVLPFANYYDDLVQLMAHGGTATTPTLVVSTGDISGENYLYQTERPWDDPKVKRYVQNTLSMYSPLPGGGAAPPYARGMISLHVADELWDIGFRSVARSLKKLDEAGVLVNAGGHGQIQGLNLHWEMWLMAEGGMGNHSALQAGTLNGAKTLGVDHQVGTLEVGKLADLIVLDKNPLDNIRNTNTIRYTMVNGRLYDSLSMNEIGNYNKPRGKFYWELENYKGIEWNASWADDDKGIMGGAPHRH